MVSHCTDESSGVVTSIPDPNNNNSSAEGYNGKPRTTTDHGPQPEDGAVHSVSIRLKPSAISASPERTTPLLFGCRRRRCQSRRTPGTKLCLRKVRQTGIRRPGAISVPVLERQP